MPCFISRTVGPSFSSTTFQNLPAVSNYIPKCPMSSTIHSYAPHVAFLLAVSTNTTKSCHTNSSTSQHTKCTVPLNSFFTIVIFVLQFQNCMILTVSPPWSALCPVITVSKNTLRCAALPIYPNDAMFSAIFVQWKWNCCRR